MDDYYEYSTPTKDELERTQKMIAEKMAELEKEEKEKEK